VSTEARTSNPEAKVPWLTTQLVLDLLREYRCQFSEYREDGESGEGGVHLVDMLTPAHESSVTLGQQEMELLADFIAAGIADKCPGETSELSALQSKLDRYMRALQTANGFLIMHDFEPVKLEYEPARGGE
jgi:hypothetical protein